MLEEDVYENAFLYTKHHEMYTKTPCYTSS